MKKNLIRIICCFIPVKKWRKKFRAYIAHPKERSCEQIEKDRKKYAYVQKKFKEKHHLDFSAYKVVSLGQNCVVRSILALWGLKPTKGQGELSFPFDLSVHALGTVIKAIKTDFEDYLKNIYFDEAKQIWSNGIYDATYNHDTDCTTKEAFYQRYEKRIENFKNIINTEKNIFFVCYVWGKINKSAMLELYEVLQQKMKDRNFHLIFISEDKEYHLKHAGISIYNAEKPYKEYIWWKNDRYFPEGIKFEKNIATFCYKKIVKKLQSWGKNPFIKNAPLVK